MLQISGIVVYDLLYIICFIHRKYNKTHETRKTKRKKKYKKSTLRNKTHEHNRDWSLCFILAQLGRRKITRNEQHRFICSSKNRKCGNI